MGSPEKQCWGYPPGDWRVSTDTGGRRQDVLRAALACFIERGYAATTIAAVSRRSGASTGSIYHHFKNKEDLAKAVWLHGYRSFAWTVQQALRHSKSPEVAIRNIAAFPIRWARKDPEQARVMLYELEALPVIRQYRLEIHLVVEEVFSQMAAWIAKHSAAGAIRSYPPAIYLALWCGSATDFVRKWLSEFEPYEAVLEDAERFFADAAWNVSRA